MITLKQNSGGGFLIVNLFTREDFSVIDDQEYPGVAKVFGWVPQGYSLDEMIMNAWEFLRGQVGNVVEDPGYFD